MSLTHSITQAQLTARQEIAQQIDKFLADGKRIRKIKRGVSGYTHDPKRFSVAKSKARVAKLEGKR